MSIRIIGKRFDRWDVVCGLLCAGLGLSGCQTQAPEQQFAEVPPALTAETSAKPAFAPATAPVSAATSVGGPEVEVLGVGSTVTITLLDTPIPIPPYDGKIKEDGTITLTLNETFTAAGKTPGALEREIRDRYVPNFYKYMTAKVQPEANTLWYYVDGEVKAPNRQLYTSRITVLKALASASGFTDYANKKKVKLTRADGRTQIINCAKARDNPILDLEVYPGDKLYVPRRFW